MTTAPTPTAATPRRSWPVAAVVWVLLGVVAGGATLGVVLWGRWGAGTRRRAVALAALLVVVTAAGWLVAGVPSPFEVAVVVTVAARDWVDLVARAAVGTFVGALLLPDARPPTTGPSRTSEPSRTPEPLDEVDRLRALAIVTVLLIHGLPFRVPAQAFLDHWLADVTRFSVATLIFLSGWLLPQAPVGLAWLRRRLWRILPPYLLASVLMLALSRVSPVVEARPVVRSLLTASAVGPYYYVAVLVLLTLVTPLLLRLRRRTTWWLFAGAAIATVGIELADLSLVAHNYQPMTWLGYYLAGYLLRPHRDRLRSLPDGPRASAVALATALVAALAFTPPDTDLRRLLTVLAMWAVLAALLVLALAARSGPHAIVRRTSRQSYLLYLYHPPLVAAVAGVFGSPILSLRPVSATAIALVLCLAAGALATTVWGDTARRWLGA